MLSSSRPSRLVRILLAGALLGGMTLVGGDGAGAAALALTPVRQIGGPGHAGLYGWGAATLPDGKGSVEVAGNRVTVVIQWLDAGDDDIGFDRDTARSFEFRTDL